MKKNSEEYFLKYLDGYMNEKEAGNLEKMLNEDIEIRHLFEKVKEKRDLTVSSLNSLYDLEDIDIPPVTTVTESMPMPVSGRPLRLRLKIWHFAAGIAIIIALSTGIWLVSRSVNSDTNSKNVKALITEAMAKEQVNYYINPNRAWNDRQLVLTITKK